MQVTFRFSHSIVLIPSLRNKRSDNGAFTHFESFVKSPQMHVLGYANEKRIEIYPKYLADILQFLPLAFKRHQDFHARFQIDVFQLVKFLH